MHRPLLPSPALYCTLQATYCSLCCIARDDTAVSLPSRCHDAHPACTACTASSHRARLDVGRAAYRGSPSGATPELLRVYSLRPLASALPTWPARPWRVVAKVGAPPLWAGVPPPRELAHPR